MQAPDEVCGYLGRLVEQLTEVLGDRLLGAYALGGVALGDFRPGSSDIDVYAVSAAKLEREECLAVARACRHGALPCPAKRLELVVLTAAAVPGTGTRPDASPGNDERSSGQHLGLDHEHDDDSAAR